MRSALLLLVLILPATPAIAADRAIPEKDPVVKVPPKPAPARKRVDKPRKRKPPPLAQKPPPREAPVRIEFELDDPIADPLPDLDAPTDRPNVDGPKDSTDSPDQAGEAGTAADAPLNRDDFGPGGKCRERR